MIALALLACGPSECVATVDDDVRTTVNVDWTARAGGTASATFDPGDGETATTEHETDGRDYTVGLYGLLPLTDVPWTAITTSRGGHETTCAGVTRTGNLPAGLPDLTVTVDDRARQSPERYLLGGASSEERPVLFAIDRTGRWRWYHEGDAGTVIPDVEFQRGTNTVLFTTQAVDRSVDLGRITAVELDGTPGREMRIPLGHHVFAQGPDGDLAWLAIDVRPWTDPDTGETNDLVGDVVNVTHRDGTTDALFSIWDHLEPVPRANWTATQFYPQGLDWSHGNGLNWSPERQSYVVSFGNATVVFEIDDTTGAVLRQFGGAGGYRYEGESTHMFHQHDAKLTPEGTLLVAETTPDPSGGSGAIEYAIDDDRGVISEIWSSGLDGTMRSKSLGQVIPLQNGNRLVSLGASGVIREVTLEGDVVWQVETPSGWGFANAWPFDDFYAPTAP